MLGTLRNGRLAVEELHRFPNVPLKTDACLHWDVPALFGGVKEGLKKAAALGEPIASVSCDSWGLDCVLLDEREQIISPTFHYRDARTERGVKALLAKVPWETVFAETGIQFMPINTLFHLAAESPERLARTAKVLPIGDAFNWMLCGAARAEVSFASTTQLYNPRTRDWSPVLLDAVGLCAEKFPPLVPPGTRLGRLLPEISDETGLGPIEVIATCSHDTGAAVAAVPASLNSEPPSWAYLSSGTWSLMGVEITVPVITDRSRELNFTNEIGFANSVRLLKNIGGLWLVQECRRAWARAGQDFDYATLTALASAAPPFAALINPADARFLAPENMPATIAEFCRETGQSEPRTPGAFIRCALESLALLYRRTLRQIEELLGTRIERLHVVGGGSKNALLNQLAANACGVPVFAGPAEATAIGNILVQAIALGQLPSLAAAREVVRNSTAIQVFRPCDTAKWDEAAVLFEKFFST
ncbi:MAG: rhamnulokinase [Verrucomicrobia bacterium]|nr:rhamnulokinase [Verrucomicrobiota bacterium]